MRMKRDRCLKRSMAIPDFARDILRTLEEAGFEAYCVGGCVRDTLLGREPGDWDITTSAWPEETLALFGEDALPTGLGTGRSPSGGLTEARRSPPSAGTGTTPTTATRRASPSRTP